MPAGRPKNTGSVQRQTRIAINAARAVNVQPIDVLVRTMAELWNKGVEDDDMQMKLQACQIAEKCAPYIHPRLQSVEARVEHDVTKLDDDRLDAEIRNLLGTEAALAAFVARESETLQ